MKVIAPKETRGLALPRLFEITMNEFDVERLLPSLFYLVVTRGHRRGSRVNDPGGLTTFVQALSQHKRLHGFDNLQGLRLLDRWVRTSVVRMGGAGKGRQQEKIEYLLPLNLLTFKAGWPDQLQRQRNVHEFLFRQMLDKLRRSAARAGARSESESLRRANDILQQVFIETFGSGARIDLAPPYDGSYDGTSEVDAETLLCLCFLDCLRPTPAAAQRVAEGQAPALPSFAEQIATDVLTYLLALRGALPIQALTRGLMAIINLDLFIYTLKLAYAIDELVRTRSLPQSMRGDARPLSAPQLYVDFTRVRGGASDELALGCVGRDLAQMRVFFEHIVLLRTLDLFAQDVPSLVPARDLEGPSYLLELVRATAWPDVQARAQATIGQIRSLTLESLTDAEDRAEADVFFRSVQEQPDSVTACADLLSHAQSGTRVESVLKWFGSVGGLNRPYGLIRGLSRLRSGWRYQMTDDLLATLVQLAVVQDRGREGHRIRLGSFLAFLETRFGILIDRLPDGIDDANARAAAAENLEAMKRRLRQMGFFADLSDDFNAQYLDVGPPGAGE